MARNDTIDIRIGSDIVSVPAWATESSIQQVAGFSEVSAKALNAILKEMSSSNSVIDDNKKILDNILGTNRQNTDQNKKSQQKQEKRDKNLMESLLSDGRKKQASDFKSGMDNLDLEKMSMALAGAGILGTVAGLASGTLVQFSKDLIELTNVGAGIGDTLLVLKQRATESGLSLEDYSKLISGNMESMKALGGTVDDGARNFSDLSKRVRANAEEFNNFGMTNSEINQVIADEIDIRRRSGMQQAKIADSVAGSMNELLVETDALARMTGQDKREVMRSRLESAKDPVMASYLSTLSEEQGEVFLALKSGLAGLGPAGEKIGELLQYAIASDVDPMAAMSGELGQMLGISDEVRAIAIDMHRLTKDGIANNSDSAEYQAQLTSQMARLANISQDDQKLLRTLAVNGVQAAAEILSLTQAGRLMESDVQVNLDVTDTVAEELKAAFLIALPSTLETFSVTMKDAMLEQLVQATDAISKVLNGNENSVAEAGSGLIGVLRNVTSAFEGETITSGIANWYSELDSSTQKIAALTAALAGYIALADDGPGFLGGVAAGTAGGGIGGWIMSKLGRGAPPTPTPPGGGPGPDDGPRPPKGWKKALKMAKVVPLLGTAIAAGAGAYDKEYQDAGIDVITRGLLGIGESLLDIGDLAANTVTGAAKLVGVGPGWDNDIDLSQVLRDIAIGNTSEPVPEFDPTTNRSQLNNQIIGGVKTNKDGSIGTDITESNAWRHGERGQEFLRKQRESERREEMIASSAAQTPDMIRETNQLISKLIRTIEERLD
jgi:hypothetical protein